MRWRLLRLLFFVALAAGCKSVSNDLPVAAPDVRAAATSIESGSVKTRMKDLNGHEHTVAATSSFVGLAPQPMTLAEIGHACSGKLVGPAGLAPCPTDAPALAARGADFRGPWLRTERSVPDGKAIGSGVLSGLVLGALGGFVVGQVACFDSSGCGDGGRAAFVVADIVLGVAAIGAVAILFIAVTAMHGD